MSSNELASFNPYYWLFVPDEKTQEKLLLRMASIEDSYTELWQGFDVSMETARQIQAIKMMDQEDEDGQ